MATEIKTLPPVSELVKNEIDELKTGLGEIRSGRVVVPSSKAVKRSKEKLQVLSRENEVMERGWDPWVNPKLITGHIEMPLSMTFRGMVLIPSILLIALFTVMNLALMGFAAVDGLIFLTYIAPSTVFLMLAFYHDTTWQSDRQRAFLRNNDSFYVGGMPIDVWKKYRHDRGLFDQVMVASHEISLFEHRREPTPAIRIGDPLLVGRIGTRWYVGAAWDLDKELRLIPASEEAEATEPQTAPDKINPSKPNKPSYYEF